MIFYWAHTCNPAVGRQQDYPKYETSLIYIDEFQECYQQNWLKKKKKSIDL